MRTLGMPMPGGLGRIQKDVVYLDPLFYILVIFLGALPIFFIGVLSQENAVLVGKVNLTVGMGALGILMIHSLFAVKQVKIKWLPLQVLFNRNMFILVLALLGGTYISQYLVFVGTTMQLSATSVLSGKLFYGSVGIFEEGYFGLLLFLLPNALLDNSHWTAFNFVLNPVIFGVFHIFVLGGSLASLTYVILPRILFNLAYVFFAVPSVIMLAHFSWNFAISQTVASIVTPLSITSFAVSLPQLSLLSALPPIGLILWSVLR
jgi:hypothetical protein